MTKKRNLIKPVLVAFLSILVLVGCSSTPKVDDDDTPTNQADAIAFDAEYAEFNGKTNSNGVNYLPVTVGEVNPYEYITIEEATTILKSGTGIIYFGFPTCPWCRNLVPVLTDVANKENVKQIYYVNILEVRDVRKLDDKGEVVVEKEGAAGYADLLLAIGDIADAYDGLEDPSIKRLYAPTVIFVKEGEIKLFHAGTVDSQIDPYVPLNTEQTKELYDLFAGAVVTTLREACDTVC